MKKFIYHALPVFALSTLLAACGSGNQVDQPIRTAAAVSTVPGPDMPAPDCAADGCHALRIIDANAEAFRHDAAQRQDEPQS